MAIQLPRFPFSMIDNDVYHYMRDSYVKDCRDTWSVDDIVDMFGRKALDEVLGCYLLVLGSNKETVKLAFKQIGTLSNLINTKLQKGGFFEFHEMLDRVPKSQKCQSSDLKNYLSFLADFDEVQVFNMPGCGFTIMAADGEMDKVEQTLNALYKHSEDMEPRFVHQMSVDDGIEEINRYHSQRPF